HTDPRSDISSARSSSLGSKVSRQIPGGAHLCQWADVASFPCPAAAVFAQCGTAPGAVRRRSDCAQPQCMLDGGGHDFQREGLEQAKNLDVLAAGMPLDTTARCCSRII